MSTKKIKHQNTINDFFDFLHEDWMNEKDKREFNNEVLKAMGKNLNQLDEEIEVGVKNGYSPERQMAIIREFIA